jgi:hypothetical protein
MKDAGGHGSNGRGYTPSKDPIKRARQIEHIRASFERKRAAQAAELHRDDIAEQHGIDISHLKPQVDQKAADDFADALSGKW